MTAITIPLSEQRLARLRELAEEARLTAEELLRHRVERRIDGGDDFNDAARYVLQKNAELYRRLA